MMACARYSKNTFCVTLTLTVGEAATLYRVMRMVGGIGEHRRRCSRIQETIHKLIDDAPTPVINTELNAPIYLFDMKTHEMLTPSQWATGARGFYLFDDVNWPPLTTNDPRSAEHRRTPLPKKLKRQITLEE